MMMMMVIVAKKAYICTIHRIYVLCRSHKSRNFSRFEPLLFHEREK